MYRLLFLILIAGAWLGAAPLFTLTDPTASGLPGATITWDFEAEGAASDYYTAYSSFLWNETNPGLGSYQDEVGLIGGPADGVLPPDTPWTGILGYYVLSGGAAPGQTNSGIIRVLLEQYSDNPLTCEDCYVGSSMVDLEFLVTVGEEAGSDVPEPGTWALLTAGLVATGLRLRRRRAYA